MGHKRGVGLDGALGTWRILVAKKRRCNHAKNQVGCGKHMLNAIIRGMCGRGLGKISIRPQVSWGSVIMGMSPSEIARLRAHEAR